MSSWITLFSLAFCGRSFAEPPAPTHAVSCEIVAEATLETLSNPLQDFFIKNKNVYLQNAVNGPARLLNPGGNKLTSDYPWQFIMLDAAAPNGDARAKMRAVKLFPHKRSDARKMFKKYGVSHGGSLPWTLLDFFDNLRESFRVQDENNVLKYAGFVTHCSTFAALPFNTTIDRDGVGNGNPHWEDPLGWTGSVRMRCHNGFVRQYRDRLSFEIRVWPGRIHPVDNPRDAVFELLRQSHFHVDRLSRIDADILKELQVVDQASFLRSENEYYHLLSLRAGDLIESRLKAGSALATNLITAAWASGGKPALDKPKFEPVPDSTPSIDDANAVPQLPIHFIGSRNSSVFHRSDCSHAARIKAENRVSFDTPAKAKSQGRKPCKTCAP